MVSDERAGRRIFKEQALCYYAVGRTNSIWLIETADGGKILWAQRPDHILRRYKASEKRQSELL